MSYIYRVGQKK